MLQLVLGGSGSGKTTLLYQKMKERALAGQKSILIIPEQFTASTEARIYRELGDAYSGMVESLSFTTLAERVLASCGGAAIKTLTEAGRAVLVRRAMKEVQEHLTYYRKQRQNAAFCQMVAQTIDELKSAGVSAAQLSTLAEGCGSGRDKIADLALIFAAYESAVSESELDPTDRVNLAARQLAVAVGAGEVPAFLQNRAVYIDEFDTFNAPKKQLLGALFSAAPDITVALCGDGLVSTTASHTVGASIARPQGQHETDGRPQVAPTAEPECAAPDHKPTFFEDVSLFSGARRVAFDLRTLARKAGVGVAAPILLRDDLRHAEAPALAALEAVLAGKELEPERVTPVGGDAHIDPQDLHEPDGRPQVAPTGEDQNTITLFAAKTREAEATAAAAEMQRLVRTGARYGEMAIVCRSLESYRTVVQRACRLAGVPLFCDEVTTPTFSAPVTAIRALLSIVRGVDYTDQMIALAKTGLCGVKTRDNAGETIWHPIPEYQILALENYVYTWSPTRAAWQQPFTRNPDGFGAQPDAPVDETERTPPAERARQSLLAPVQALCDAVRGKTIPADALTKQLYFCLQAFGADAQQAQQVAAVRKVAGIPAAEAAAREWNVVMELLDQMVRLLGEEPVAVSEYAELFLLLLNTSDLGHIPQNIDAVIFTSAGKMRLANPQYVFVLGLAEGEFPRLPAEHGLLRDADRDALMAQNIELPDCFENKMVREDICFYKALTAPAKRLWLSWPEGLALPVSSVLAAALAAVKDAGVPVCTDPQFALWQSASTPAAAIDQLGDLWAGDTTHAASLYAALQLQATETNAPWGAALQHFEAIATDAPKQLHQPAQVGELLGDEIRISPSKVEQYYTCQYKYFLQYLLRLRPRQKAELSPSQNGSLMHWVLEQALSTEPTPYDEYKQPSFVALDAAQLKTLGEVLVDAYQALYMPDDTVRFGYLMTRLKKSMVALLGYLQAERKQSSFVTAACEATIGTEDFPAPEYQVTIETDEADDGGASHQTKTVALIGVIDRIDTWQATDGTIWMRVVDYKTGQKSFNLKEVYDGLDCQMLLYLFAALKTWKLGGDGQNAPRKAAGVQYLLADPAPQTQERAEASTQLRPAIEGMLSAHASVLNASDKALTGVYLPFTPKDGLPDTRAQKAKLADEAKMARIETHLDGLVTGMARGLYEGNIKAEPLCPSSSKNPCVWCEFRAICRHEDGKGERGLTAPAEPFAAPLAPPPTDTL